MLVQILGSLFGIVHHKYKYFPAKHKHLCRCLTAATVKTDAAVVGNRLAEEVEEQFPVQESETGKRPSGSGT